LAILVTGATSLGAAGCVGVLGLDDDNKDAVSELCVCVADSNFGGDGILCKVTVDARLKAAPPHARQAWLASFAKNCESCGAQCESVYLTPPTCTDTADDCATSTCTDCCYTTPDGGGTCAAGNP
jgi:hypothetical protein